MPFRSTTAFGSDVFGGSYPFASYVSFSFSSLPTIAPIGLGEIGVMEYTRRAFVRPEVVKPILPFISQQVDQAGFAEITFYARGGGIIGRLRSDNDSSIVLSLSFVRVNGDCRDFSLIVSKLPDFDVPQLCHVSVQIGNNPAPWYYGRINQTPRDGHTAAQVLSDGTDQLQFLGFGLQEVLQFQTQPGLFPAGMDIGQVVYHTIANMLANQPDVDFKFNPGLINRATGTVLTGDVDLSLTHLDQVLQWLADASAHDWGVNANGDFFFLPRVTAVMKVFFDGYDFKTALVKEDLSSVVNSITIQRLAPVGTGQNGWTDAAYAKDTASISRWGPIEAIYQVPAYLSDHDAQAYANELLASGIGNPKINIQVTGIPVRTGFDALPRGVHRIVGNLTDITTSIQACDDLTTATLTGIVGDAQLFLDTEVIHTNDGSFRLDFTHANGARIQMQARDAGPAYQNVTIWLQVLQPGKFTLAVGNVIWNEFTFSFAANIVNRFFPIVFDLSRTKLSAIKFISIVVNSDAGIATSLWIDSITAKKKGYPSYEVIPARESYSFAANKRTIDVNYGPVVPPIESYVKNIQQIQQGLQAGQRNQGSI